VNRAKKGFAEKLAAIVEEARVNAPKSVYIVLYLLYACYLHGKQDQFAKYCCGFSALAVTGTDIAEEVAEPEPRVQ
jgi:hypothetical protein